MKVTIDEIIKTLFFHGRDDVAERIKAHGIAPPDGFALVPIEPTAGMVEAYSRASEQLTKNHLLSGSYPAIWQPIEAGYKAMLAAAKDKP